MPTKGTLNGIARVHLVAAELSLRGFSVAVTARNTEGVDLYASSPKTSRTYSIQAKTSASQKRNYFWPVGRKPVSPNRNLIYVFVNIYRDRVPALTEFYVVPSKVVADHQSSPGMDFNSFHKRHAPQPRYSWNQFR